MPRFKTVLARISCLIFILMYFHIGFVLAADLQTKIVCILAALFGMLYMVADILGARILALLYFTGHDLPAWRMRISYILGIFYLIGGGLFLLWITYQAHLQFRWLKLFMYGMSGGAILVGLSLILRFIREQRSGGQREP